MTERYYDYFAQLKDIKTQGNIIVIDTVFTVDDSSHIKLFSMYGVLPNYLQAVFLGEAIGLPSKPDGRGGVWFVYDPKKVETELLTVRGYKAFKQEVDHLRIEGWRVGGGLIRNGDHPAYTVLGYRSRIISPEALELKPTDSVRPEGIEPPTK